MRVQSYGFYSVKRVTETVFAVFLTLFDKKDLCNRPFICIFAGIEEKHNQLWATI